MPASSGRTPMSRLTSPVIIKASIFPVHLKASMRPSPHTRALACPVPTNSVGSPPLVGGPRSSQKASLRSQDPSIVSDSHDEFTAPCRSPNVLPGSDQHLPEILAPHQDIPSNQTNIAEETSRYPPVPHNIASEPWHHPRLTAAQMAKLPPRFQEYVQDGLIVDGSWSQTGLSSALPTKIPCGFGKPFHSECKAAFQSYTTAAAHFPKRVERDCTRMK
jgi:hypothetical protein